MTEIPHINQTVLLQDLERESREFDPTITMPKPPRHDLYSAALAAVRETENLIWEQQQIDAGRVIYHAGTIMARGDCEPDRPGTIRRPGTRRIGHKKQKWAIWAGQ